MGSYTSKMKQQSIKATVLSFWDLAARDIDNNLIQFRKYKGKKAFLIVNVCSNSDLTTTNFTFLNQLYSKYHFQGLQIFAFPCGLFGNQLDTNQQIKKHIYQTFKIKFLLFQKVYVNDQEQVHPVYSFLRQNSQLYDQQTDNTKIVSGDFAKFLVDQDGKVVKYFMPEDGFELVENEVRVLVQ